MNSLSTARTKLTLHLRFERKVESDLHHFGSTMANYSFQSIVTNFSLFVVSSNGQPQLSFKQELRQNGGIGVTSLNDSKLTYSSYSDSRSIDYISPAYFVANNGVTKPTLRPTKILLQENDTKSDEDKLLKNECSRTTIKSENLIKTELNESVACRSVPGHGSSNMMNSTYDPYLNNDSNSSSVSSMDALNHSQQYQIGGDGHMQIAPSSLSTSHGAQHASSASSSSSSSSAYMIEEKRLLQQQQQQLSSYDSNPMVYNNTSEDMYQQQQHQHHDRTFTLGNINRPVPSYSSEINCGFDGRPYDSETAYDRFEPSSQPCDRYPPPFNEQNVVTFHHPHQPQPQTHLQATLKTEQCPHQEQHIHNGAPLYLR